MPGRTAIASRSAEQVAQSARYLSTPRRHADAQAGRARPGIATATDTKAYFVIEPTPLLCLDFEASGNDPRCYPIEVAIANVAPGNARDWLIAPTPAWLETGLWQAEAEAIHGLSRAEIIAFGRSVADVARELAAYAQGAQVLSDAPTFDGKWLRDLYTAAGTEPPFVLLDFHQFIWHEAATRGRRPDIAIVKAEAEAYLLFPKQHRAGPDARRNAEMIRQVRGR